MQAVRQRRTSQDNSRGMRPSDPPNGLRGGLVVAGPAGVAALVLATFSTVIRITVGTTSLLANLDTELSGWDRHGPALLIVAGLALVMLVGAARGARPAMFAVLACGVVALVVAGAFDLPGLDDTGQVGELYADAAAGPRVGFWLEVGGGALLVLCGGGLLAVAPTAQRGEGATAGRAAGRGARYQR